PPALGAFSRFAQRTVDRREKARQPRLENIIGGAKLERLDREFLAETAGDKDERQLGARARCELQCGKSVEGGKVVVGENKVDLAPFQRSNELGTRLNAGRFTDQPVRFKQSLNQIGVAGVVLQQ